MPERKGKNVTKLELTDEEVFILQIAIAEITRIPDREYRNPKAIAEGILNRLPKTKVVWEDVER